MRSLRDFFPNRSRVALRGASRSDGGHTDLPTSPAWRTFYVAALFEADERRMPQRIAEAKGALVARARELFLTPDDHLQEQSAIDEAFQALHALEQCAEHLSTQRK